MTRASALTPARFFIWAAGDHYAGEGRRFGNETLVICSRTFLCSAFQMNTSALPEYMTHYTSATVHHIRYSFFNMRSPGVGSVGATSFSSWCAGRFSRVVIMSARMRLLWVGLRGLAGEKCGPGVRGDKSSLGRCLGLSESTLGQAENETLLRYMPVFASSAEANMLVAGRSGHLTDSIVQPHHAVGECLARE